jgi:photosystem II stability/assembly factor-like uncharacterized protein
MFVECHVRALVSHPEDPHVLFAGTEQGLYRSLDGADNWTRVDSPLNNLQIWSILLASGDSRVILVGTCPSRLFHSTDAGRTWREAEAEMVRECPRIMRTRVTSLLADPTTPGTLWAGVEIDGLFRSRDGGQIWQPTGQGLSSRDIHALAAIPGKSGPARLLASTNNDLNWSEDGGTHWLPWRVGQTLPWPYCRALAQQCGRPEVVLLGTGDRPPGSVGAIARSTDGGLTWKEAALPGPANSTIWNFATHAADPDLIYASSVSGEVYRSNDVGVSWVKLPREFGEIRSLVWTP